MAVWPTGIKTPESIYFEESIVKDSASVYFRNGLWDVGTRSDNHVNYNKCSFRTGISDKVTKRAVCLEPLLQRASQRGTLPYGSPMVFFYCSSVVASWKGSCQPGWLAG
jgi:hypothetical protein